MVGRGVINFELGKGIGRPNFAWSRNSLETIFSQGERLEEKIVKKTYLDELENFLSYSELNLRTVVFYRSI